MVKWPDSGITIKKLWIKGKLNASSNERKATRASFKRAFPFFAIVWCFGKKKVLKMNCWFLLSRGKKVNPKLLCQEKT